MHMQVKWEHILCPKCGAKEAKAVETNLSTRRACICLWCVHCSHRVIVRGSGKTIRLATRAAYEAGPKGVTREDAEKTKAELKRFRAALRMARDYLVRVHKDGASVGPARALAWEALVLLESLHGIDPESL